MFHPAFLLSVFPWLNAMSSGPKLTPTYMKIPRWPDLFTTFLPIGFFLNKTPATGMFKIGRSFAIDRHRMVECWTKMLILPPTMDFHSAESAIDKAVSATVAQRQYAEPSHLETEVTGLFDEFRPGLLRYFSSFGLLPEDGEEIVQEVFVLLFLHLRAGKSRSNIRGWIFRVAHNLGLKRRERVHRILKTVSPLDRHSESHLDAAPDPEQHLALYQRWERTLAIVNILPEQDRRCLFLRAEGLRYRDIANILDISLGGVALSLARSLSRLKKVDQRQE